MVAISQKVHDSHKMLTHDENISNLREESVVGWRRRANSQYFENITYTSGSEYTSAKTNLAEVILGQTAC